MISTFYSFKGGVGRSTALANVGELLYRQGKKVLMVDFNLQSPGLEDFFNEATEAAYKPDQIISYPGFVDLLLTYKELYSFYPKRSENNEIICEPLENFLVPIYRENKANPGSLSMLSAGKRDTRTFSEYANIVQTFSWADFYTNYQGGSFFDWFTKEAQNVADYVLIDASTGIGLLSGICTHLLADLVVIFASPNEQNLKGCRQIASSLSKEELIKEGRKGRPLNLIFVPSHIDIADDNSLVEFVQRFNEAFIKGEDKSIANYNNLNNLARNISYFDYFKVPYTPFFSCEQRIASLYPNNQDAKTLVGAFQNLSNAITQQQNTNPL